MTECSIVIPTYQRPGYLKRILGYYNDLQVVYNIIIADGSSDEIKQLNRETVSSFPGLKIQHLEKYSPETSPYVRVADALEYVNTRYCVFCADDDFITPNGIKQSVDFLQTNPDFAVAHGYYLSFHLEDNEEAKQHFCWKLSDSHESIIFADPTMRLSRHLSDYSQSTFYAVHRTEFLRMAYKEVFKFSIDPVPFGELLLSMLTVIYGKMKCLDVLYVVRTEHVGRDRPMPITDAIESGTYNDEYAKFRDCLAAHLSKQAQLGIEESGKLVDDAMSAYLKKYCYPPKRKMGYITTRMGQTLDSLHLPGWLNRGIRRLYEELVKPRYMKKHSKEHGTDVSLSSQDYDDLNRVRRQVLSCSK